MRSFGAVQAQDFDGAKWAVGQRVANARDATVERAFQDGGILRTHVLRPTWHFVAPEDIRWMLALTGPRVKARMMPYNRLLELDAATFRRSEAAIARALRGGNHLTRTELSAVLAKAGIEAKGQRLAHLMMEAELDQVVCSGPRRGKEFTYALLDERSPAAKPLDRDRALAELTRRYFVGHGPATTQDFSWWSGLTASDSRAGIEMLGDDLEREDVGSVVYHFAPGRLPAAQRSPSARLLPNYDEYYIALKDRSVLLGGAAPPGRSDDPHVIVVDGVAEGGWRRRIERDGVSVSVRAWRPMPAVAEGAVRREAGRYARFLEVPLRSIVVSR